MSLRATPLVTPRDPRRFLDLLVCPETRHPLAWAEPALIERLNRRVAQGTLRTRGGGLVLEPLEAGLVRSDGLFLYPLRRGIPVMLMDQAIPLT
jgi:uncharacterized protein